MSRPPDMTSSTSPSTSLTQRNTLSSSTSSTPQGSRVSAVHPRRSNARDFGTPIKVESSSPYRTPEPSSKAAAFLAKTAFPGTPNKASLMSSASTSAVTSSRTPGQPPRALTGRAQLTARVRSLWFGGSTATAALEAKGYLPYSELTRLMLRTNLDRLYLLSFLALHIFLCSSLSSPWHPISSLIRFLRPTLLLLSLLAFLLSLLPLIIWRRTEVTNAKAATKPEPTHDIKIAGIALPYGSPAMHYYSIFHKARIGLVIGSYALSGLLMAASHAAGLLIFSEEAGSWLPYHYITFRNQDGLKVSSLRPNERFYFLLGSNCFTGLIYILHRNLSISPVVCNTSSPLMAARFEPQSTIEAVQTRLSGKLRRGLLRAALLGAVLPTLLLTTYFAARRPLFRLLLSIIGHNSVLRPLLIPSFRLNFLSFGLAIRIIVLGIFSTMAWETLNVLWEVFATQPFVDLPGGVSQFSREPTRCLVEGMQSRRMASPKESNLTPAERQYFSHFAFAEMALLASTDVERRKAIFRDVGANGRNAADVGSGSAWIAIAQECLKVLEEERVCVTSRGKQSKPTLSVTTTSLSRNGSMTKALDNAHKATVEDGNAVLKQRTVSIWDRLASPSAPAAQATLSKATPPVANATQSNTPIRASDGLHGILHRIAPASAVSQGTKTNGTSPAPVRTGDMQAKTAPSTTAVLVSLLLQWTSKTLNTIYILLPLDLRHVLSRMWLVRRLSTACNDLFTSSSKTILCTGQAPCDPALATWSIQILAALLSASVDQDEYGTVALSKHQKLGTDDALEAMAALLQALNQWGEELAKEMQDETETTKQEFAQLWDRRVAPIILAARTAITLVLGVFEPAGFQLRQSTRDQIDRAMSVV